MHGLRNNPWSLFFNNVEGNMARNYECRKSIVYVVIELARPLQDVNARVSASSRQVSYVFLYFWSVDASYCFVVMQSFGDLCLFPLS